MEIDKDAEALMLWVRRKRGNKRMACGGCGPWVEMIHEATERGGAGFANIRVPGDGGV